jgi:hypothetical protein
VKGKGEIDDKLLTIVGGWIDKTARREVCKYGLKFMSLKFPPRLFSYSGFNMAAA